MITLGHLFRSAARTEILRALYYQPGSIGFRQLARVAGVGVRSAELALDHLVNEKLVERTRRANRVFYALKRSHPSVSMLTAVFDAAARSSICANRERLTRRARRILPFIRRARRMIDHARSQRNDARETVQAGR